MSLFFQRGIQNGDLMHVDGGCMVRFAVGAVSKWCESI